MAAIIDQGKVLEAEETNDARLALQEKRKAALTEALHAFEGKEKKIAYTNEGHPLAVERNVEQLSLTALPVLDRQEEKLVATKKTEQEKGARLLYVEIGGKGFSVNKPFHRTHSEDEVKENMRRDKVRGAWKELHKAIQDARILMQEAVDDVDDRTERLQKAKNKISEQVKILQELGATLNYAKAEERWSEVRWLGRAADVMELLPIKNQQVFFMDALRAARVIEKRMEEMLDAVTPLVHSTRLQNAAKLDAAIAETVDPDAWEEEHNRYDHVSGKLAEFTKEIAGAVAKDGNALANLPPERQGEYAKTLVTTIRTALGGVITRNEDVKILNAAAGQWYALRVGQCEEVEAELRSLLLRQRLPGHIKDAVTAALQETAIVSNILREPHIPVDISRMKESFQRLEEAYESAKWRVRGEGIPLVGQALVGRALETKALKTLSGLLERTDHLLDGLEEDRLSCRLAIAESEISVVNLCIGNVTAIQKILREQDRDIMLEREDGPEQRATELLQSVLDEAKNVKFAVPDRVQQLAAKIEKPFEGVSEGVLTKLKRTPDWTRFDQARKDAMEKMQQFTTHLFATRDETTQTTRMSVDDVKEALKEMERQARVVAEQADGFLGKINPQVMGFHLLRKTAARVAMENLANEIGAAHKELDDAVGRNGETLDQRLSSYDKSARMLIDKAIEATNQIADQLEGTTDAKDNALLGTVNQANEQLRDNKKGMDIAGKMFSKN